MSKSNDFETDFLQLIFNGTTLTGIAQNATAAPKTKLYVSLHTGALPESGSNQQTNECAYGAYSRVGVNRTASAWVVSGNAVNPGANIDFPAATSGTETATHFAIGTAATGAGYVLYSGTVSPNISISNGVTPRLTTASSVTED